MNIKGSLIWKLQTLIGTIDGMQVREIELFEDLDRQTIFNIKEEIKILINHLEREEND